MLIDGLLEQTLYPERLNEMEYRKLGNTDVTVSAIAMGCWAIVGDGTWGEQDEKDALDAIRAALDVGVTTFDTAEGYGGGYSEEMLGAALEGRRDEAVILTKVSSGHLAYDDVKAACERSLKRLRREYIDLYQIHWPSRKVPLDETWRALDELKREGKIRAIGVSNFGPEDLGEILALGDVASNQLAWSLLFRAVEYHIQPLCVENNLSILPYSPLMQGLLTGKFATADDVPEGRARTRHFSSERPQAEHGERGHEREVFAAIDRIRKIADKVGEPIERVALAWLLAQEGVACVLAGARNVRQITDNAKAGEVRLSDEIVLELAEATETLKTEMGANPDMWLHEPRIR